MRLIPAGCAQRGRPAADGPLEFLRASRALVGRMPSASADCVIAVPGSEEALERET
ncbi:hypothetical protein [Streptomyces echinatus]|uniref:Uncharacterized protein n=1 Tax=Streptomyces echinatus TaxID=67293 RepID=A0A7W9PPL0_9ACTN|nr:hypothetical protein [Streptomyces echinatus]MBB5925505.1 hypothetical protein [Streptomyces echinatus]